MLWINCGNTNIQEAGNLMRVLRGTKRHVGFIIGWAATDIRTSYKEWRGRGAEFLTEPRDHGVEIRCYMRDPDGYLIEVGQTTAPQV